MVADENLKTTWLANGQIPMTNYPKKQQGKQSISVDQSPIDGKIPAARGKASGPRRNRSLVAFAWQDFPPRLPPLTPPHAGNARSMKILDLTADVATIGIADIAQQKLRESPYYFLKNLTCHYDEGVLTLRGRVPMGPLKQLAESIVCRVDGVHEVDNRIEVVDPTLEHATHRAVRNAG
jgi:hypothetical protein